MESVWFLFWWCPLLSLDCFHKLLRTPSENSQAGWGLGNRMATGYRFDAKWVCPMESFAWGIQVFCSRNKVMYICIYMHVCIYIYYIYIYIYILTYIYIHHLHYGWLSIYLWWPYLNLISLCIVNFVEVTIGTSLSNITSNRRLYVMDSVFFHKARILKKYPQGPISTTSQKTFQVVSHRIILC